jgi:hypothetical protein
MAAPSWRRHPRPGRPLGSRPGPARSPTRRAQALCPLEARAYLSPACRQYATMMPRVRFVEPNREDATMTGSARRPSCRKGRPEKRKGRGARPANHLLLPRPALRTAPAALPQNPAPRSQEPMKTRGPGHGFQSPGASLRPRPPTGFAARGVGPPGRHSTPRAGARTLACCKKL